ncbi:hypothetical protein H696_06217 [Fonticula alba]|uniref:Uncharacterized protein n=1 Tax=Fonticula alba TaxID=691883 RepID=A0A058YZE8_FONAL|nr:hypothetical protein H696_06217 [Fonticula alba]KCV67365.1 hypothetical protein H696_06217 [Fonticula alba]|eukprot:XP_009498238.1 hypothetical protein H696_06217 [Fonticula alba]
MPCPTPPLAATLASWLTTPRHDVGLVHVAHSSYSSRMQRAFGQLAFDAQQRLSGTGSAASPPSPSGASSGGDSRASSPGVLSPGRSASSFSSTIIGSLFSSRDKGSSAASTTAAAAADPSGFPNHVPQTPPLSRRESATYYSMQPSRSTGDANPGSMASATTVVPSGSTLIPGIGIGENGIIVATASRRGHIWLWRPDESNNLVPKALLLGHFAPITALADVSCGPLDSFGFRLTPMLASVDEDGVLMIWSLHDGRCLNASRRGLLDGCPKTLALLPCLNIRPSSRTGLLSSKDTLPRYALVSGRSRVSTLVDLLGGHTPRSGSLTRSYMRVVAHLSLTDADQWVDFTLYHQFEVFVFAFDGSLRVFTLASLLPPYPDREVAAPAPSSRRATSSQFVQSVLNQAGQTLHLGRSGASRDSAGGSHVVAQTGLPVPNDPSSGSFTAQLMSRFQEQPLLHRPRPARANPTARLTQTVSACLSPCDGFLLVVGRQHVSLLSRSSLDVIHRDRCPSALGWHSGEFLLLDYDQVEPDADASAEAPGLSKKALLTRLHVSLSCRSGSNYIFRYDVYCDPATGFLSSRSFQLGALVPEAAALNPDTALISPGANRARVRRTLVPSMSLGPTSCILRVPTSGGPAPGAPPFEELLFSFAREGGSSHVRSWSVGAALHALAAMPSSKRRAVPPALSIRAEDIWEPAFRANAPALCPAQHVDPAASAACLLVPSRPSAICLVQGRFLAQGFPDGRIRILPVGDFGLIAATSVSSAGVAGSGCGCTPGDEDAHECPAGGAGFWLEPGHPGSRITTMLDPTPSLVESDSSSVTLKCYLVSGSADGMVRVWNLKTRQLLATFLCHSGPITALLIPPPIPSTVTSMVGGVVGGSGGIPLRRCIISVGADHSVAILSMAGLQCVHMFGGHPHPITSLICDGERLFVSCGTLFSSPVGSASSLMAVTTTLGRDALFSSTSSMSDNFSVVASMARSPQCVYVWHLATGYLERVAEGPRALVILKGVTERLAAFAQIERQQALDRQAGDLAASDGKDPSGAGRRRSSAAAAAATAVAAVAVGATSAETRLLQSSKASTQMMAEVSESQMSLSAETGAGPDRGDSRNAAGRALYDTLVPMAAGPSVRASGSGPRSPLIGAAARAAGAAAPSRAILPAQPSPLLFQHVPVMNSGANGDPCIELLLVTSLRMLVGTLEGLVQQYSVMAAATATMVDASAAGSPARQFVSRGLLARPVLAPRHPAAGAAPSMDRLAGGGLADASQALSEPEASASPSAALMAGQHPQGQQFAVSSPALRARSVTLTMANAPGAAATGPSAGDTSTPGDPLPRSLHQLFSPSRSASSSSATDSGLGASPLVDLSAGSRSPDLGLLMLGETASPGPATAGIGATRCAHCVAVESGMRRPPSGSILSDDEAPTTSRGRPGAGPVPPAGQVTLAPASMGDFGPFEVAPGTSAASAAAAASVPVAGGGGVPVAASSPLAPADEAPLCSSCGQPLDLVGESESPLNTDDEDAGGAPRRRRGTGRSTKPADGAAAIAVPSPSLAGASAASLSPSLSGALSALPSHLASPTPSAATSTDLSAGLTAIGAGAALDMPDISATPSSASIAGAAGSMPGAAAAAAAAAAASRQTVPPLLPELSERDRSLVTLARTFLSALHAWDLVPLVFPNFESGYGVETLGPAEAALSPRADLIQWVADSVLGLTRIPDCLTWAIRSINGTATIFAPNALGGPATAMATAPAAPLTRQQIITQSGWALSPFVTAHRLLSIVSVLNVLSSSEDLSAKLAPLVQFYTVDLVFAMVVSPPVTASPVLDQHNVVVAPSVSPSNSPTTPFASPVSTPPVEPAAPMPAAEPPLVGASGPESATPQPLFGAPPSVAFLSMYWIDPSPHITRACQAILRSTVTALSDSAWLRLLEYWLGRLRSFSALLSFQLHRVAEQQQQQASTTGGSGSGSGSGPGSGPGSGSGLGAGGPGGPGPGSGGRLDGAPGPGSGSGAHSSGAGSGSGRHAPPAYGQLLGECLALDPIPAIVVAVLLTQRPVSSNLRQLTLLESPGRPNTIMVAWQMCALALFSLLQLPFGPGVPPSEPAFNSISMARARMAAVDLLGRYWLASTPRLNLPNEPAPETRTGGFSAFLDLRSVVRLFIGIAFPANVPLSGGPGSTSAVRSSSGTLAGSGGPRAAGPRGPGGPAPSSSSPSLAAGAGGDVGPNAPGSATTPGRTPSPLRNPELIFTQNARSSSLPTLARSSLLLLAEQAPLELLQIITDFFSPQASMGEMACAIKLILYLTRRCEHLPALSRALHAFAGFLVSLVIARVLDAKREHPQQLTTLAQYALLSLQATVPSVLLFSRNSRIVCPVVIVSPLAGGPPLTGGSGPGGGAAAAMGSGGAGAALPAGGANAGPGGDAPSRQERSWLAIYDLLTAARVSVFDLGIIGQECGPVCGLTISPDNHWLVAVMFPSTYSSRRVHLQPGADAAAAAAGDPRSAASLADMTPIPLEGAFRVWPLSQQAIGPLSVMANRGSAQPNIGTPLPPVPTVSGSTGGSSSGSSSGSMTAVPAIKTGRMPWRFEQDLIHYALRNIRFEWQASAPTGSQAYPRMRSLFGRLMVHFAPRGVDGPPPFEIVCDSFLHN